ncbi:unnamed protein product [Lampetra planeri]
MHLRGCLSVSVEMYRSPWRAVQRGHPVNSKKSTEQTSTPCVCSTVRVASAIFGWADNPQLLGCLGNCSGRSLHEVSVQWP